MLVEDAHIYKYIRDYINEIPVVGIKRGGLISKAFDEDNQIYYILEGQVKVETVSNSGRKILVDTISEDEFAGQISYMRNSNLYCDSIAKTDAKLLCLKNNIMNLLMEDKEFSTSFYAKTSSRIYEMYKKMLMNNLFNQCDIVAYYILKNSDNYTFMYKSIYDMCETLNISRRGLYNILNKYQDSRIIEKGENSSFNIIDYYYLYKRAEKINKFLSNDYY